MENPDMWRDYSEGERHRTRFLYASSVTFGRL
jgi:hypothetical protein